MSAYHQNPEFDLSFPDTGSWLPPEWPELLVWATVVFIALWAIRQTCY